MADLQGSIRNIVKAFEQAKQHRDARTHAQLASVLSDAKAAIREHIQRSTHDEITGIIRKLRGQAAITGEDLQLIKLWVAGDADSYVTHENNFENWVGELERLSSEVRKLEQGKLELAETFHLQAMVMDGLRVAWDVHHFLEQKERLAMFEDSTHELDHEERAILADVLERKAKSDTM